MTQEQLAKKLLSTGWQSWSTTSKTLLKDLICNFPPKPDNSLPEIPQHISLKPPVTGWCSYYAFFNRISEKIILKQTDWFQKHHQEVPIEYILIDDGYSRWGDWLDWSPKTFPSGPKHLIREIKSRGFKAGIWLAPFLVEPKSELALTHPDWLIKDSHGHPVEAFQGSGLDVILPTKRYLLNFELSGPKTYLDGVIKTYIEDYGFELLKLDFLYAPYFDQDRSSIEAATIVHNFLLRIKLAYPKIYTIGCGCPLIPAVGVVDSLRIGPDVTLPLLYSFPLVRSLYHYFTLKGVLHNVDSRFWTKEFWNLDPDVFVCSPKVGFTRQQILLLQQAIKKCQGNIFLGDDLTKLSEAKIKESILPLFQP